MNSIAASAGIPIDLLSGSSAFLRASAATPRFLNLINVAIAPGAMIVPDATPRSASPRVLADSLIRQMLGKTPGGVLPPAPQIAPEIAIDQPAVPQKSDQTSPMPSRENSPELAGLQLKDAIPSCFSNVVIAQPPADPQAQPTSKPAVASPMFLLSDKTGPVDKKSVDEKSSKPARPQANTNSPHAVTVLALAAAPAQIAPAAIPLLNLPSSEISTSSERPASDVDRFSSPDPTGTGPLLPPASAQQVQAPPQPELAFSAHLTPIAAPANSQPQPESKLVRPAAAQTAPPAPAPKESDRPPAVVDAKPVEQNQHEQAPVRAVAAIAAISSAADFNGGTQNPAPQHSGPTESAAAFGQVAETLRTSESTAPAASAPVQSATQSIQQPVQKIAVRVTAPNLSPVDLQVTGHAGEIHVAVHTSDAALESSLRQDLGTLTNSLERAGYHTETFVPQQTAVHSAESAQMNSRDDRQGQSGSSSRDGSGNFSNGRQQQQNRDQRRHAWLEEMENLK